MQRRLFAISFISMGLAACGGFESPSSGDWTNPQEPVPGDNLEPIEVYPGEAPKPRIGTSPLESCDIEMKWWTSDAQFRATPQHFEFTADGTAIIAGADVFGSGHSAWSSIDGAMIYASSSSQIIDSNRDQTRVLQRRFNGTDHVLSVAPLEDLAAPIWSMRNHTNMAELDGDGDRVAHVRQRVNGDGEHQWYDLTITDVDTGQVLHEHTVANPNVAWWAHYGSDYLTMSDDGKHVALGLVDEAWDTPVQPRVVLLSERSTGWEHRTIDVPFTTDADRGYNGQISTLAFTPDDSELIAVSASGDVIRTDTSTGAVTAGDPRGAFAGNWDTYLPPLPASPVKWTQDGRVQFSVAPDGALEVSRGQTVLQRVTAAEDSDAAQFGWELENSNPVIGVAVNPSGDAFAVGFRTGLGVWGCVGDRSRPEVSGTTSVRSVAASARRSAESPYRVDIDVTLEGDPRTIHGYVIYEDGEARARTAWDSPLMYHSASTDPVSIVVEFRDAFGAVQSQTVRLNRR